MPSLTVDVGEVSCPRNSEIDEEERVLRCSDCGKLLDPYEYLLSVAKREKKAWTYWRDRLAALRDEVERLEVLLRSNKRKVKAMEQRGK